VAHIPLVQALAELPRRPRRDAVVAALHPDHGVRLALADDALVREGEDVGQQPPHVDGALGVLEQQAKRPQPWQEVLNKKTMLQIYNLKESLRRRPLFSYQGIGLRVRALRLPFGPPRRGGPAPGPCRRPSSRRRSTRPCLARATTYPRRQGPLELVFSIFLRIHRTRQTQWKTLQNLISPSF